MSEGLCVHDMQPGTCGWCTGRDGGEAADRAEVTNLAALTAQYPGHCAACGDPFKAGDRIRRCHGGWAGPCCT